MNNKMIKKIFTYGVCLCMAFSSSSIFAYENNTALVTQSWDSITWEDGGILDISGYTAGANKTITIPSSINSLTILGDSSKIYEGLVIEGTSTLKLTIQNLNINNGYIDIAKTSGENKLILKGNNSVIGKSACAAIVVKGGDNKLIIDDADGTGKLTVQGGSKSAGIGGGHLQEDGHIIIQGGTIKATGGNSAPGIGSGGERSIKSITIKGNAIIELAQGGAGGGAGIGGANSGSTIEKIEILDQAIIKSAIGTSGAAGIGEGKSSGLKYINILGSSDTARVVIEKAIGGEGGAGIGGGDANKADLKITIKNATIKESTGGTGGAGIGGGCQRGADILIGDGAIIEKATGGSSGAGIGSGPLGESKTITIEGKSLIKLAQGGEDAAGIGGGDTRSASIYITGGNIELAQGGANAAGIGFGAGNNDSKPIIISGGVMHAVGGSGLNTNDIGAGNYYGGKNGKTQNDSKNVKVTITGGTVLLGNNRVIGKETTSHTNYMVVGYETYPTVKMSNKKIYWRTIDNPETNGELSSDAEGRTTFILEEDIAKIQDRKYWFVVVENEGQPTEKSYIGLLAEEDPTKWITTYYDDSNNIVAETSAKYSVKEIPIQYYELVIGSPVTQTVVPKGEGNRVIPYSTSNIGYSIDFSNMKTTDPNILDFVKVKGEIQIVPDNAPGKKLVKVEFLTSKASGGVAKKTSPSTQYVNEYKDSSKFIFTPGVTDGANMKFECIGNWIAGGDYQVVAYVPTEGLTDNTCATGENLALDQYKTKYVTPGYKMNFNITGIVVTVKWQTYQYYTPMGGGTPIKINGPIIDKDIPLNDTLIEVQFYDIPEIN